VFSSEVLVGGALLLLELLLMGTIAVLDVEDDLG